MSSERLVRVAIAAELLALGVLVIYRVAAIGTNVFATRDSALHGWVPFVAGACGVVVLAVLLYWILRGAHLREHRMRGFGWLVLGALAFGIVAFFELYVNGSVAPRTHFSQLNAP